MRALAYDGPHRVAVRNKPDPRIEQPAFAVKLAARVAVGALLVTRALGRR